MADSKKASSSVKSGVETPEYTKILGGIPPKKSVDEIDRQNMPKDAPDSVGN
jgi:hypothetical protein